MMSKSYSGGTLFGGLDARQYRSTESHIINDLAAQSNNGVIKLEILEAADLPSEVNPFCYAWLFVNTEEYNHFSGTGSFSIDTLESYLSNIENSPQVQTCTLHSTSDPVWRESFTLSDAILCSHEVSHKVLVPLAGRSATVVISVHNTLGVFGMEEMVGRAYIKDLRPGDIVNQWCLLYRSDQQQVLGRTGKPTAIHLRIEYLKHSRTLAWTEASSAESNLMSVNPLASSSRIRPDQARKHMSLSSLPSFSKRGPIVVSQPKRQNQTPLLAEPPMDLLMQSREAASLHQQNLALSKQILHKSSLAPLLPFIYENQEWYVIEGICSGDKVIEIGPRRTNKPVAIRYCKGDSNQIVVNLQGVTEMIHIENCSNLRLMVSLVSNNILLVGCRDVEIIVGRIAPTILLLASKQCTVMVCKETWKSVMQCIGCVGIFVHTAHSNGIVDLEPYSLLTAPIMERILLPDVLLTQIKLGTITTQCHFSEQLVASPLDREVSLPVAPSFQSAPVYSDSRSVHSFSDSKPRPLRDEIERMAQPLYTSQTIPDKYGVGMLLRKHDLGFKIEKIAPGGPAWKDGMIQEGDILVGIQGIKTRGKSTREVSEELSGPEMSKVVLSMNRHNASTGVVNVFDVTLQRGPLNQDNGMSGSSKSLFVIESLARSREQQSRERLSSSVTDSSRVAPIVIKDRKAAVVGVGLGVRPNSDGSYSVSGIVPYSSAELCGKIRVGDILHSVDGVPVCGKPYETVRDLVQGPYGTQVMIAFLRPEATSDNLQQGLNEFESWRPVVLTRGLCASATSPLQPSHQSSSAHNLSVSPRPLPNNSQVIGSREAVAVALWLNEEYDVIAGDQDRKALFSAQLAEDLANTLQTSSRRIIVVDLLKGVVADINLMPDYLEENRSPESLAKEIADMASDPISRLRTARTTFRAIRAEVRGPVSQVRPLREVFSPDVKSRLLIERERSTAAQAAQLEAELREREEAERRRLEAETQERFRQAEEQERLRKQREEENRLRQKALEQELLRQQLDELEHLRKQNEELDALRKKTEEFERMKRFAEEQERLKKIAEEQLLQKKLEEQELQKKEAEEKERLLKAEAAELERRKKEAIEHELQRLETVEQERLQKLEQEEKIRRKRLDEEEEARRRRMDEEESLRRKKMDEEEQERRKIVEAEIQQRKKLEEEERTRKEIEERERKQREQIEQERLKKEEEDRIQEENRIRAAEEDRIRAEEQSRREREQAALEAANQRRIEEENNRRRIAEMNAEEERRQQQQQPLTDVSLNLPMISPGGDRRPATMTPRSARDAIRRVSLVRAPNQGRPVNPGEDVGVGISFQAARTTNNIVVVSIAPGSSAEASGQVFVGDIIHRINNTNVQGKRIPAVVSMIKGPPGTTVVMELQSGESTPAMNTSNLYSSVSGTTTATGYNTYSAPPPPMLTDLPGARLVSLTRQPIGPNAAAAGPEDLVGVGLGFVVTEGTHIVSALAPGGSAEQSGQINIGDTILSVDGVPAAGKDVDTLVGLIKGRKGTPVRLLIQSASPNGHGAPPSGQFQNPTAIPKQPGPPPRLGSSMAQAPPLSARNTAGNLSSRSNAPGEVQSFSGGGSPDTYSLRMTVRSATGLQGVAPGRVPVAVCHIRLLYPDAPPIDFESLPPVAPSLDPSYGGRVMDIPIPAARLKNVQLELTLWDDHSKDQGFMGEVVINVGKLADPGSTLGRPIEHSFILKPGGTFVPKRTISGAIVLELLLSPPSA